MNQSNKEKAQVLLQIIGVGDQLTDLEKQEKELYEDRQAIGRIADQKEKFAREQPFYPGMPEEPLSISELLRQQQEILAKNGENQEKRRKKEQYERELEEAKKAFEMAKVRLEQAEQDVETARRTAENLKDASTEELERNLAEIEETNRKVRANLDREKASEDAAYYRRQYEEKTNALTAVRTEKENLLQNAPLPLPGLAVQEGELTYNGHKWDNMSGSDQLKVSTAIVRKLNPSCGFVLLDKLEQMDMRTLQEFGRWLQEENLQAIATRVSTGGECSIVIEDGYVLGDAAGEEPQAEPPAEKKQWKAGEF